MKSIRQHGQPEAERGNTTAETSPHVLLPKSSQAWSDQISVPLFLAGHPLRGGNPIRRGRREGRYTRVWWPVDGAPDTRVGADRWLVARLVGKYVTSWKDQKNVWGKKGVPGFLRWESSDSLIGSLL